MNAATADRTAITRSTHVDLDPVTPASLAAIAIHQVWLLSIEAASDDYLEVDGLTDTDLALVVGHLHRRTGARVHLHGSDPDRLERVYGPTLYPLSDLAITRAALDFTGSTMSFSSPRGALVGPRHGKPKPTVSAWLPRPGQTTTMFTASDLPREIPLDVILAGQPR